MEDEAEFDAHKQLWLECDPVALAVRRVERVRGRTEEEVDAELDKRWQAQRRRWGTGGAQPRG